MNKLKLAAGVILLLIVGVLAGSLGSGIYYKKRVEKYESGGPPVSERVRVVLGRLSDDLDLTNEQRVEFEKIVKESQEKILTLGRKILPDIEEINEQTFASIKNKLTAEQKDKIEALIQRMKEARERFPSGQPRPKQQPSKAPSNQFRPQEEAEEAPVPKTPDTIPPEGIPNSMPPQRDTVRLVNALKEHLNLSKDQEAKVRSIMESSAGEREKILEKYRSDLVEIDKAYENNLSDILTKEQMEKYKAAKEKGPVEMPPPEIPF